MKKIIKLAVIIMVVIIFGVAGVYFFSDHTEVADGKYWIQDNQTYPDAYIEIKDGKAQFFNIDLNALYKENIAEDYILYLKNYKKQVLSSAEEDKIKNAIDLNAQFCDSSFTLDYSNDNDNYVDESGLGQYNFGYVTDISFLSYEYNWKNRTITLTREEAGRIQFKRKIGE